MYEIKKYPDGTSYVVLTSPLNYYKREPIVFRINSYESLWHLNQLVDVLNYNKITPEIIIPNLIDAQADKRFGSLQSSGLKLVMKFLSNMKANFKIFHPHNEEVVESGIENAELFNNKLFIRSVLTNLSVSLHSKNKVDRMSGNMEKAPLYDLKNRLVLMSSDAGGFKPLIKLSEQIKWQGETFSASKARSWDEKDGTKFVQQIGREDFGGKDILIIDDISVYGGTFKGLSKLLRERNCGKLYLAVSHMTMENLGTDPVTNYFDKVFTTNSKFDEYIYTSNINGNMIPNNLEVIKMFDV